MKAVKTKLKKRLEKSGVCQLELARLTATDPAVISRQTRDGVRTLRIAKRYAAALKCDPLELLG